MSAEVAGQAEGVTLLEAIEGGDVPYPERMSYVAWLKWRRETGSRPLSKRDGVSTTPEQEAALWRKVMKFLHDAEEEDEDEEEEEEDSELVPEASGAGGDSPPRVDVSAAARELAMVPTGAAYVPATAPGSRPAGPSGPPSTAGSVPGTAEGLHAELRAIFRPDQEPVADYLTRVSRIVLALKAHGVTVSSRDLDALSTKATLLADEFSKIGGDWHPTKMVRRLRTRFSVAALRGGEDPEDAEEIQREIQCIGELILALGGKESSSQEKVWSSPSDVPVEAVGPRSPGLPQPATASGLGVGLDRGGLHTAEVAGGPSAARVLGATDGDSPLRAKLAALEMEIEALKRGSDGGGSQTGSQHPAGDLAAALAAQTEALKEALAQRGGQSSITTVKTDLTWPTLTDDKSDARDVVLFYEEFEDVCALANNCRGMSAREKLLALRGRCRGSRMKTYTNAYRAAWKSGEVLSDPQAVYDRIKNKHLMFGESREEREVRVDGEHASLAKGKLTGHQFEPLFEASIADLEAVGLGKTPRELYLSYLRKMISKRRSGTTKGCGLATPRMAGCEDRRLGRRATKSFWSTSREKQRTGLFPTLCTRPPVRRARTRRSRWLRLRRRLRVSRPLRRLLRKEQLPRPKLARTRRMLLRRRELAKERTRRSASTFAIMGIARKGMPARTATTRSFAEKLSRPRRVTKPLPLRKVKAKGREVAKQKPTQSLRLRPKARQSHQALFAPFSPRMGRARKEPTATWSTT